MPPCSCSSQTAYDAHTHIHSHTHDTYEGFIHTCLLSLFVAPYRNSGSVSCDQVCVCVCVCPSKPVRPQQTQAVRARQHCHHNTSALGHVVTSLASAHVQPHVHHRTFVNHDPLSPLLQCPVDGGIAAALDSRQCKSAVVLSSLASSVRLLTI